jgi:hypothetical protein
MGCDFDGQNAERMAAGGWGECRSEKSVDGLNTGVAGWAVWILSCVCMFNLLLLWSRDRLV